LKIIDKYDKTDLKYNVHISTALYSSVTKGLFQNIHTNLCSRQPLETSIGEYQ